MRAQRRRRTPHPNPLPKGRGHGLETGSRLLSHSCAGVTVVIAFLFSSIATFAADSPGILVRTRLEPTSVSISQGATLYVEVYTDTFFTSGIALPPLNIPGAIVKLSDERPAHISTTANNINWFGIQHEYTVTPIVAVDLDIPAFEVSAQAGPASTTIAAKTRAVKLQVSAPAEAGDAFITRDLQITQKTDADLAALKVGDSFTRTIELKATGTPAMFIPDVDFGEVRGLKAYPQTPRLTDSAPDAPIVGRRTFAVNYVVQEPGDYELPAVSIPWWSLETRELAEASVPALRVHAIAAPPPPAPFEIPKEESPAPASRQVNWRASGIAAAAAIAATLLAWWLAPYVVRSVRALSRRRAEHRARYLESEFYAYKLLRSALRQRDTREVPAALYRWIDRLPIGAHTLAAAGDAQFAAACQQLLAGRYGSGAAATVDATTHLRRLLPRARHRLLSKTARSHPGTRSLPQMNPV